MKSDSASTASGVGTFSDKINLQLHKLTVDIRDRPRLSEGVDYGNIIIIEIVLALLRCVVAMR